MIKHTLIERNENVISVQKKKKKKIMFCGKCIKILRL